MKIICRYALKNSKILPRRKIRVEGIIFSLEKSVTGSATAVANRLDGALSDRAYHYVCGEGIVYALAHPTRFAAHSGGTADERYIGAALVLPAAKSDEKNCPYAVYRRSEADIRTGNVFGTAVELAADLCRRFGLDPCADGVILTRKEAAERGIAAKGESPEEVFDASGGKYSAEKLRNEIGRRLAALCG